MVNEKLTEFREELKPLQISEIQEGIEKEIEILYGLGVEGYEIEFLIHLRIKEELIMEN